MKSINCSKPGDTSIAYSKISNIPYNFNYFMGLFKLVV